MSQRIPVNPGLVEWAGNNPGIYLRETPDGPWTGLGLYFDIVYSPKGRGHIMIVLDEPDTAAGFPQANNVCITSNRDLTHYMVDTFISKIPSFLGKVGLQGMSWHDMQSVRTEDKVPKRHSTILTADGVEAEMALETLAEPFAVETKTEHSATKQHEMYAVFLEAKDASMRVNDKPLTGRVTDRQFFGKTMSTAFLALSEIWVKP